VIEGEVTILKNNKIIEIIQAGEYFGEDSLLSRLPRVSKAVVSSDWCRIITANELHIKKILTEDPEVAMRFLNHLAKTVRSL
jgi:membrane protein